MQIVAVDNLNIHSRIKGEAGEAAASPLNPLFEELRNIKWMPKTYWKRLHITLPVN